DAVAGGLEDAALELADRDGVVDDEQLRRLLRRGRRALRHALRLPAARLHERGRVEEEGDPAVAEDRAAEVALDGLEQRAEALHDDLVLPDEPVADGGHPAARGAEEE